MIIFLIKERMLWGICGGLAKYFNTDPTIVRIIFFVTIFFGSRGIITYIIMAIVVPRKIQLPANQKIPLKITLRK
jgi:phage shock protein PspC (stress-responsive transcriptional regulator)